MPDVTSNNISLDDVEVHPSRGRLDDGTKFYLADSRRFILTLPGEHRLGIYPHAPVEEIRQPQHRALANILETLTGEEYEDQEVADELAEGGFLLDGIASREAVAEHLQEEL